MLQSKSFNKLQLITTFSTLLVVIFWIGINLHHSTSGKLNFTYSLLFGLIPFIGGIVGMIKAQIWGGLKSTMGKAVFFISCGLMLWGFGETIWSYYNFFKDVPAPYPSIADFGFAFSIFFWIYGAFFLCQASGAVLAFKKSLKAKIIVISLPLFLLIPSYYVQIKLARGGVVISEGASLLKTILDIAYPAGDFIALIIASGTLVLSYKYFGGFFRKSIMAILLGLGIMYFGDSIFSYTTTKKTYYNANWGDLILTFGLFLITFGVLGFCVKPSVSPNIKGEV